MKTYIIAEDKIVDNIGFYTGTEKIISHAQKKNLKIETLVIVNFANSIAFNSSIFYFGTMEVPIG